MIPDRLDCFMDKTLDMLDFYGEDLVASSEAILARGADEPLAPLLDNLLNALLSGAEEAQQMQPGLEEVLTLHDTHVARAAASVCLSESHFRKLFKAGIGIGPKQFVRIRRIDRAVRAMAAGTARSLTELAYELGFYDQAHFIRDFKAITSLTPSAFRKALS